MSGSTFGKIFKLTSFGESHGEAIGGIIEGCPSGLEMDMLFIQQALDQRAPGRNSFVSPRKEKDRVQFLSGIFENKTTGAPIAFIVMNEQADSRPYEALKQVYKPGHASYTYHKKYGHYDHRGSGRASARETLARVVAGAIAELWLKEKGIEVSAFLAQVGSITCEKQDLRGSSIFCLDQEKEIQIKAYLEKLIAEGDSCGGIIEAIITGLPVGLGSPVFDRFEALLAHAMLSIPATKGFEIGEGFASVGFLGSSFNDAMKVCNQTLSFTTQHAGGTLGGITNGDKVRFRVVFKPPSSIKKPQTTVNHTLEEVCYTLDQTAKHDPCVAIRGTPVVKAMALCVIADCLLLDRSTRKEYANQS